jgi:hypothetical protein
MKKISLLFLLSLAAFVSQGQASFFTPVSYVGAFGATDWTAGWANWTPQNTSYAATTQTVTGDITASTTWNKNTTYLLSGFVYVKSGATLTIEAGTVIRGDKASKGTLIITKGCKLMAEGTSSSPIVFTSNQDAGQRNYGDWGGVVLLGKGIINPAGGSAAIEGGVDNANGDGQYGGTDNADNSGSLKFVRIEFPGIAFQPNSEINGLTMGGVGSGTTLENIQVSYSGDDSYEWFGGAVNAKWLIAFRGWDDDFDTDFGYAGKVQFGVALRDSAVADQSGSNGFESDNDGTGSGAAPYTSALFSNMTIIGPKVDATNPINSNFKRGAHIRRNTRESIYNSIITGFPLGYFLDGGNTLDNAKADSIQFTNNIIAGCTKFADTIRTQPTDPNFDVVGWLNTTKYKNSKLTNSADVNLERPFDYTNPDFRPKTTSPALGAASFANKRLGGVTAVDHTVSPITSTSLFPNPADQVSTLYIELPSSGKLTISICGVDGKMVSSLYNGQTTAGLSNYALPIEHLANGMYIALIDFNGHSQAVKFTVSK